MTLSDAQITTRDKVWGTVGALGLVALVGWALPIDRGSERLTASAALVAILGLAGGKLADRGRPSNTPWGVAHLTRTGLSAAVIAAMIVATDLVGRLGQVCLELVAGQGLESGLPNQLTPSEAAGWLLLATICLIGRWGLPGPGWNTALFSLVTAGVMRMALTRPAWTVTTAGSASRSGLTLWMIGLATAVLCLFVVVLDRSAAAKRAKWLAMDPTPSPPSTHPWPGFSAACTAVGLFLIIGVCYHLAIGFEVATGGARAVAGLVSCISAMGAAALFLLLRAKYDGGPAAISITLICLAICCLAAMCVPSMPSTPVERYPLTLNAATIGLAVAVIFWTWLIVVWEQQLEHGQAWTVAGNLIRPARRASFFAGLLGLVTATLMTAWPHLADAPGLDHSPGRMAAGVAGHLCLIGAMLWSARKQHRSSLIALTILVGVGMLVFIYARAVPLTTASF